MRADARSAACGFTLVETLIALVLSSLVMILVSTTFLVQNRYHARHVLMAAAHDNARAATELVARELRTVVRDGGVRVAGRHTLTVRSPVTVGTVCARPLTILGSVHLHMGASGSTLEEESIAGIGLMRADGSWDLEATSWGLTGGGASSAAQCFANGADTTGIRDEFHRLSALYALLTFGDIPDLGNVMMLFRETTFTIEPSVLDPSTAGLFRREHGHGPVEFATGIDTTSHFEYRTGGSTYSDAVSSGFLDDIDAVRIVLDARRRGEAGPMDEVTFGLSTTVALRTAP